MVLILFQEAVNSDNAMVSYHALGVIAATRKNDKLGTAKLVSRLTKSRLKSPYALCMLIRLAAQLVEDEDSPASEPYLDFIECCLRHKTEMVIYEAAHAIINLRNNLRDLPPAVSVLQLFCGSSKPSLRLAGTRTLARLTVKHPTAVQACAQDLENLISDSNRSVATLAVTTLLATGAESSIDRLMKQISSFVSEISDEFKIIVVRAIRRLCTKFPRKHQALLTFLSGMLRDEGGLEYKTAIADAIIALVEENPEAKEMGLAHLCEFIEDCEHTSLAVRVLHLLGREAPKTRQPSRYIRFIYNRVILETGPVRAAAVSTVAQFGAQRPELLSNIRVLLARCEMDDDDEVRDRAIYYGAILDTNDRDLIENFIINVPKPNPVLLLKALKHHLETQPNEEFDIMTVPAEAELDKKKEAIEIEVKKPVVVSREEQYADKLDVLPGIKSFGPLFKTSQPVELTEAETEYRVRVVKHVFGQHLVLHFECTNTLSDQLLEHVRVNLDVPQGYTLVDVIECEKLQFNKEGSIFCILEFPEHAVDSLVTMAATLEFSVKDCDPTTGLVESEDCYGDSYPLEEIEIGCAEQLRTKSAASNWESAWERSESQNEVTETFSMSQTEVLDAAKAFCEYLDLPTSAIGGEAVKDIKGTGFFRGGVPVLFRARLALTSGGVTMQLLARSPKEDVAQLILSAVG